MNSYDKLIIWEQYIRYMTFTSPARYGDFNAFPTKEYIAPYVVLALVLHGVEPDDCTTAGGAS